MTLVSQIITDAYREGNLIPITQTPSATEQTEALRLFNRFVKSVYGNDAGDNFQSFGIGNNNVQTPQSLPVYNFSSPNYVPLNARLICNLTAAATLNLHPNPQDGSRLMVIDASNNLNTFNLTLHGNGLDVNGAVTEVLSTAGLTKEWFYRADLGSWMTVSNLAAGDTFPFPLEFEDMFTIGLAMRINPRNGVQIDPQTIANFKRQQMLFKARYRQEINEPSEDGIVRLPGTWLNRTVLTNILKGS